MKNMIDEFKNFINKGDVVIVMVAFVAALYFKEIVDSIVNGVITPIIAAIFGENNIFGIGFDIGDSFISIGSVIYAALVFVIVLFILYFVVKAYDKWKDPTTDTDAGPTEIELLTEIRDSLRSR